MNPAAPSSTVQMKPSVIATGSICVGLLLILALAGCSVHYDVLLNNGGTITAFSKPKPDGHGRLVFKNEAGEKVSVSQLRVIEIKAK